MATIQAVYFSRNGSTEWGNCQVSSNDTLIIETQVSFLPGELFGHLYKAGLKIRLPTGSEFEFFSSLMGASAITTFQSTAFTKPITSGNYSIVWVTIYNEAGTIVASGCPGCV